MPNYHAGLEKLIELIQSIGYKAKIDDEDSILTAMGGYNVLVFLLPGPSLQLYLGFRLSDELPFSAEKMNLFNTKMRFAKCYSYNGGLSFEQDFFFDPNRESAESDLETIFAAWETVVSQAKAAIDEEINAADSSSSEAASA